MLESRGLATVAIGAVRVQMEKTRPPRGLFVPFQLGRPLGEPEDQVFQRRVLTAALGLLERADGPVILEDFPDDPPGWLDNPDWRAPPVDEPDFAAELGALMPWWQRAQARFGRTTVGLAGQPPSRWAAFADMILAGDLPTVEGHSSTGLAVRFLCDDIKAFYGEAAQADGPAPSSRQVDNWFWRETQGGLLLQRLRAAALASDNNALKTVGGRFFVPAPFLSP